MIHRRAFLASSAALAGMPRVAFAQTPRITFTGAMQQGALMVGKTEVGARVSVDGKSVSVSPQGLFAFGFSYNRADPAVVRADFADGTSDSRRVTPAVRHYEIQNVNGLPQNMVTPPPEDLARIKAEHARLALARRVDTPQSWFAEPFEWPFPGILSSVYGSQRVDNGVPMAPHLGVDIAAPAGTPIHAPAGARVAIAEMYFLEGNFTLLDHGHGVFTEYLHQSEFKVKPSDVVAQGQLIGLVGATGRATGPHSHWGLNWFDVKLDPSLSTSTPTPPRA
ncbi:MAG TPA: M23 family metallopeptidase [Rhizomicrobium sp.]|jgi:murein DD-endopeptidase MepM/ murein hydrolase activator NlpD